MGRAQYRLIYFGLAAALVAVIALGLAFANPDGEAAELPEALESIHPQPGSQVSSIDSFEVDLPVGYVAELWIDFRGSGSADANWVRIPDNEITFVEATGVHSWRPGPDRLLDSWQPGRQRVRVVWDTISGLPDAGAHEWAFRVTS